jgi:hypothetical protein
VSAFGATGRKDRIRRIVSPPASSDARFHSRSVSERSPAFIRNGSHRPTCEPVGIGLKPDWRSRSRCARAKIAAADFGLRGESIERLCPKTNPLAGKLGTPHSGAAKSVTQGAECARSHPTWEGGSEKPAVWRFLTPPIFRLRLLRFSFSYQATNRRDEIKRNSTRSPRRGGVGSPIRGVFAWNCCISRFATPVAVPRADQVSLGTPIARHHFNRFVPQSVLWSCRPLASKCPKLGNFVISAANLSPREKPGQVRY